MTVDAHIALARCFIAVIDAGDLDALHEVVDPAFVLHLPGGERTLDLPAFIRSVRRAAVGLPDLTHHIQDVFGAGDRVALRLVVAGVHTGAMAGLPAPAGRRLRMTQTMIMRFAAGRLVEMWEDYDTLGYATQLAVVDPPPR